MSFARTMEPEWLDTLPASDPRAIASRRDLKRINTLMLQTRAMALLLRRHAKTPPRRVLELGGGDGTFLLGVARKLPWRNVAATLVDLQDIVTEDTRAKFAALGWRLSVARGDVFDYFRDGAQADAIIANLFLHHFDESALTRLFTACARAAPLFAACEPRRSVSSLAGAKLLFAIGCNDVTRHDAVASVRAGFTGSDLSSLWPQGWVLHEHAAPPFTHSFAAVRR